MSLQPIKQPLLRKESEMALRKIIEAEGPAIIQTPVGNIANGTQRTSFSAYVKVVSINGDKNQVTANVHFIGDVAKFIKQYTLPVSVETGSPNFIEQAYKHLKTLPELSGAEDC
jgi:hypothetical protein